jgi:hypothetical protein
VGRFKGKNESPCRKGGVPRSLPWSEVLSIFSGHSSISMLIRCAESSILVGCAYNALIGHVLILTLSLFWSILLFLLSTLQDHTEVRVKGSRALSVSSRGREVETSLFSPPQPSSV